MPFFFAYNVAYDNGIFPADRTMKLPFRIVAAILFVIFFGFALKNTHEASLHFFLGYGISGPLILLLLGFFTLGAVFGILAMTPTVFKHRREATKHQKALAAIHEEAEAREKARTQAPSPDVATSK